MSNKLTDRAIAVKHACRWTGDKKKAESLASLIESAIKEAKDIDPAMIVIMNHLKDWRAAKAEGVFFGTLLFDDGPTFGKVVDGLTVPAQG